MNSHRERILGNLRNALRQPVPVPDVAPVVPPVLSREERRDRLQQLMTALHTEVHRVTAANWVEQLKNLLRQRQLNGLLYAPDTVLGTALEQGWESDLPPLTPYRSEVEQCKEMLFTIDASITSTRGGIAETGALILWPDDKEPRLMSLVPAIHIAVLDADRIYNHFGEVLAAESWQNGMPTNALLISGPSKTADIELVLTFGVHGPKELIVLLVDG